VTTLSTSAGPQCPYVDPGATEATFTPAEITAGDAVNACYTRPNSQYAAINQRGSYGSSSYNALNVAFKSQNLHHTGLSLILNYTYAHSLDDLSTTFSDDLAAGSLGYTDYLNPKLDWGSSDFDVTHRVVLSPIWQTPWFKDGQGWQRQALGGWTIASVFTAHTGIPFSIYDLSNLVNDYTIPRLTPATPITQFHTGTPVPVPGSPNLFTALNLPGPANLDANGVELPLNPVLGLSDFGPFPANMTRRNAFRAPGAWNDDLAISKTFRLTERFGLEFRAEAFNVFNHHNFYVNPGDDYYTGTPVQVIEQKGGLGDSALGGNKDERRFGQFALKLTF
jgi:hypothetical protein